MQAAQWRLGQASSVFNLVITRTPDDKGSLGLVKPIGRSEHDLIRMRLTLRGLVAHDAYGGILPVINKIRMPDLGLQTWWELDKGSNYVDRQSESIKINLLATK